MGNEFGLGRGLAGGHHGLLLVMVLAALAEGLWRRRYDFAALWASLAIVIGQQILSPVSALAMGPVYRWFASLSPHAFPASDWRTWAVGFIAVEFAYYWFHRFSHTVRWLWATHSVHHTSHEMVLPAAARLGWTGPLSLGWLCFVPLVLLGLPVQVMGALLGANLLWQFWLHTEAIGRLGPLEWVLNTLSAHRAHHSRDEAFLDCNFGGVLIVFDRLFGTYRAEPAARGLNYGLHGVEQGNGVMAIAFGEWRRMFAAMARAPGFVAKARVALGRPGADQFTTGKSI